MKQSFTCLMTCIVLVAAALPATAQINLLDDLLRQLEPKQLDDFMENLENSPQDFNGDEFVDQYGLEMDTGSLDSLANLLVTLSENGFPLEPKYLEALAAGKDVFNTGYYDGRFNDLDRLILNYAYDLAENFFTSNEEELENALAENIDQLELGDEEVPDLEDYGEEISESQSDLNGLFNESYDRTKPKGLGDVGSIINKLFSKELFSAFEIAYGRQMGSGFYASDDYSVSANLLRFGSVPNYNSFLSARWHVEGSWTPSSVDETLPNNENAGPEETGEGINPLKISGNFAMMLNPGIIRNGGVNIRLLTSLGIEVATYAPAHRDYSAGNADNTGFTTGFGPQLGTGFAIVIGDLVTFSQTTATLGSLYCDGSLAGTYKSLKFESGVRYGNRITVRYVKGFNDWTTPTAPRGLVIDNQFSVGLIIGN